MRIPHITLLLATVCLVSASDSGSSHKRVPSGFTGVRGKKSIPDSEYGPQEYQQKHAPSGLLDAGGKKLFDGWTADKRRPTSGFFGMRGKKEAENDFYKRAPNGFFGMRGKKEFNPFYDDGLFEKRAPAGFFGMRGKKDDELGNGEFQVSPPGFFDARDKKQPARAGFFGMRGKKYPYEFRGKFVGVRGKKKASEEANNAAALIQQVGKDLDINQLMLLLTENEPYKNTVGYHDFNNINN